jgi:hypothetical protein
MAHWSYSTVRERERAAAPRVTTMGVGERRGDTSGLPLMPDSLIANNVDAYLTPWGVVNRLKSVFSYVEVDGEEGRRHVLETIARLRGDRSRREIDHRLVERLTGVKKQGALCLLWRQCRC